MKTFDPTKPAQTRSGHPARILCTDRKEPYSIVALVGAEEEAYHFTVAGMFYRSGLSEMDLINIPAAPVWRPWKPEEVPVGALIKPIKEIEYRAVTVLQAVRGAWCHFMCPKSAAWLTISDREMLESYLHSVDGGKTWLRCGVQE
jgi:hypothetical protein